MKIPLQEIPDTVVTVGLNVWLIVPYTALAPALATMRAFAFLSSLGLVRFALVPSLTDRQLNGFVKTAAMCIGLTVAAEVLDNIKRVA